MEYSTIWIASLRALFKMLNSQTRFSVLRFSKTYVALNYAGFYIRAFSLVKVQHIDK